MYLFKKTKWIDYIRSIYFSMLVSSILYLIQNIGIFTVNSSLFYGIAIFFIGLAAFASSELYDCYFVAEVNAKQNNAKGEDYIKNWVRTEYLEKYIVYKFWLIVTLYSWILIFIFFVCSLTRTDKNRIQNTVLVEVSKQQARDSLRNIKNLEQFNYLKIQLDTLNSRLDRKCK